MISFVGGCYLTQKWMIKCMTIKTKEMNGIQWGTLYNKMHFYDFTKNVNE